MEEELELGLQRLAADRAPPRLALIEEAVLQRVAGHRFAPSERLFRIGWMVTLTALLMGMVGGLLPPEHSPDSLTPLLDTSSLAPVSLLEGGR